MSSHIRILKIEKIKKLENWKRFNVKSYIMKFM